MITAASALWLVYFTSITPGASANFLQGGPTFPAERISLRHVKSLLHEEIDKAVGHNTSHDVLAGLEAELKPMFTALPKNGYGNLGQPSVRFALHRFFRQKYSWFIKGLEPVGHGSNISDSVSLILKDRLPNYIEQLFEEKLGSRGFALHELALFAHVLQHLVHEEAVERLRGVYAELKLPTNKPISIADTDRVLEAYLMIYVVGGNVSAMPDLDFKDLSEHIQNYYPGWTEAQEFAHNTRREVMYQPFAVFESSVNFASVLQVAEAVGTKFGQAQEKQCLDLKNSLLKFQERQSGRVRLSDFYKRALTDEAANTRGIESPDYLRELGALDEFQKERPRVIIPNYVNSPSSCLPSSSFYSVCCADECDALLGHLEERIAAPTAAPKRIAKLVSMMASSTVDAPRQLSAPLLKHLDTIAQMHHGRVPLHGRLFAQWMHHAYPRECAFPYAVGKTRPMSPKEFQKIVGVTSTATVEEMKKIVLEAKDKTPDEKFASQIGNEELEELPWTTEEELLVMQETWKHADMSAATIFMHVVFIGVIASTVWLLIDALGTVVGNMSRSKVRAKVECKANN